MPFLSPVMVFAIVTGMIYTFQYFTEAFVASPARRARSRSARDLLGYPGQSLLFYSTELYQQGFVYFKTGYASAMAWMLFVVIFVCDDRVAAHVQAPWVLRGGRPLMAEATLSRPRALVNTPRAAKPRRFLMGVAEHSLPVALVPGLRLAAARLLHDRVHDPATVGDRLAVALAVEVQQLP